MIQYKSLVQYSRVVDGIRFPLNTDQPILFLYFSENSLLVHDYPRLNLRKQDLRYVVVPLTKMPVVRLTSEMRTAYRQYGLLSYSSNMNFPKDKNIIYDTSYYTHIVDSVYKPSSYRQRAGYLIQNILNNGFQSFPPNYKKILVYSVDTTKPMNDFVNKKIYPIIKQLKAKEIMFDDMIFVSLDEDGAKYRLLVKDKDYKLERILSYIKRIKVHTTAEEQEEEAHEASNKIIDIVTNHLEKPSIIKGAIKSFMIQNPQTAEKVSNDETNDDEIKRLTVASVLYSVNGNMDKAKRISNSIPKEKLNSSIKSITKQFQDELLEKHKSINGSISIISQSQNTANRVDNKTPEHIFEKRKIDFETNLKKDLTSAFKVLEKRDIPLKLDSIRIVEKDQRAGELAKTDEASIIIKMKDKHNQTHDVNITIPRIDPNTGTFRVNGKKKCMINQIVLNPISFPKPYDSKFESSYSMFHIYSKRTIRLKYLEIYMGSFRLPLMVLLSYSFGFDETLKQYGIRYKMVKEKPEKDQYFIKSQDSYILFENVKSELQQELISSLINSHLENYESKNKFLSKEYFNDFIINMTGRIDATYLINNNLQNIVDPIVKQVLINQQLPFELELIIQYMASKCVTGYVQDRNDLTFQRIRNSEVLVHLAQKQLLKAYTEYREQYLSGNKEAKINIPEIGVLTQFSSLEIVQDMEYANPIEEMATITKVSPVGKTVGGIPDKQAVQLDARNVHPSYYGNIDPLDTAEGGNIGITQQLTVNAYITSARGLFGQKPLNNNEKSGILSTSAAMVPFVENNEGARIIMSTNQAKQMLPLKNPEPPICQSGYESLLTNVLSDSFIKRAPCDGKVSNITIDYIEILCKGGSKNKIDITPIHLKSGSGKNTLSTFKTIVKVNQSVKTRDIIAEGSGISNGTISLGRNLACCYMPYKGYNYEDGLVLNERLVEQDKLTSLHGVDIEATVEKNDKVVYIVDLGKDTIKGEPIFRKFPSDLDELLGYDEEEDENTEIYDGQIIEKSPGGKVVDIEVYSNLDIDAFPVLKPYIERTNKKYKKPPKEKYTERGIPVKGIKIVFKIEQELRIGNGDKLCNRFGNKGIVSLIEKNELMPRTPWGDTVDIVLNPLGVLSRMNMGQIYEMYCGLISKTVSNMIIKNRSRSEAIKLLGYVMNGLDTSTGKVFGQKFIQNLTKLSDGQFKEMVAQIEHTGFFPIIIPPFQAPTYKQIIPVMKKLGLKSGYKLKLPEYNRLTESEVPFGYLYMSKLEHIGEVKLHARSTGPAAGRTGQPTAGKRREGGQRIGEGDTWALASYNCPILLSEFFGPMSDDSKTKNEIVTDIIQTGSAEFRVTKNSPTKDLLNAYFVAMMIGE